jgi:hypothetical protein
LRDERQPVLEGGLEPEGRKSRRDGANGGTARRALRITVRARTLTVASEPDLLHLKRLAFADRGAACET